MNSAKHHVGAYLQRLQLTLLQETLDVASAMNHGEYTDRVNIWLINDQVGVEREKQDVHAGKIFPAMALSRCLG